MKFTILLILAMVLASAQTAPTHSVTLTWSDPNPAGATYTIYRATGLCSGTPVFSKLATALTAKTYPDLTVTPGNYCYTVTATEGGVESPQSVPAAATVPAFAPTGLALVVQ